jgi:hypothetical protein
MMVPGVVDYTSEIVALRSAIASGATSASYDGKSISYDNLEGMKRRLALIEQWQRQVILPGSRLPQAGFATFTRR